MSLRDRHVVFQPAHHVEPVVLDLQLLRREGQWQPELVLLAIGRSLAQHADDGVWQSIEPDLPSDDVGGAGEAVQPEPIGQHDDLSRPTMPSSAVNERPSASGWP